MLSEDGIEAILRGGVYLSEAVDEASIAVSILKFYCRSF